MKTLSLRDEALAIIKDLEILPFLQKYGDPHVVGSVALDLVVKQDIDIQLLVAQKDLAGVVFMISRWLLDQSTIAEVRISDWRSLNSFKIGVDDYRGAHGLWTLDIWVTSDEKTLSHQRLRDLLLLLTPAHRRSIMTIKRHYHRKKQLRHGLSAAIYDAVVYHAVRTIKEFEAWHNRC